MEAVTVTDFLTLPAQGEVWTVDDFHKLPNAALRYELAEGSVLVGPPPFVPHASTTNRLHNLVASQAPAGFQVGQGGGVTIEGRSTYFIPDLFVVRATAYRKQEYFDQDDMLLVVEVLSPGTRGRDLVLKRHYYASGGIPHYWIVDSTARTLTVVELDGEAYREAAVVAAGTTFKTEEPFPLSLDPAEFV